MEFKYRVTEASGFMSLAFKGNINGMPLQLATIPSSV